MKKPLFIAPIDIKETDTVWLLFGHPVMIVRDDQIIWRDYGMDFITPDFLEESRKQQLWPMNSRNIIIQPPESD